MTNNHCPPDSRGLEESSDIGCVVVDACACWRLGASVAGQVEKVAGIVADPAGFAPAGRDTRLLPLVGPVCRASARAVDKDERWPVRGYRAMGEVEFMAVGGYEGHCDYFCLP